MGAKKERGLTAPFLNEMVLVLDAERGIKTQVSANLLRLIELSMEERERAGAVRFEHRSKDGQRVDFFFFFFFSFLLEGQCIEGKQVWYWEAFYRRNNLWWFAQSSLDVSIQLEGHLSPDVSW